MMKRKTYSAYQLLISLVRRGKEFPGATAECSEQFKLSDKDFKEMVDYYDEMEGRP